MELTLKAAHKLETKIQRYISEEKPETFEKIRASMPKEDAYSILTIKQEEFGERFTQLLKLHKVVSVLRDSIGQRNQECGLNGILTKSNGMKRLLADIDEVLVCQKGPNQEELADLLDATRTMTSDFLKASDRVYASISLVSQKFYDELKEKRKEIKNDIEKLEEEVQRLNFTNKIVLNAETIDFLRQLGLL